MFADGDGFFGRKEESTHVRRKAQWGRGSMKITAVFEDSAPNEVRCHVRKSGNAEYVKTLSVPTFIHLLRSAEEDVALKRIGKLPLGFLDGAVTEDQMEAILHVPGAKRPFKYFGSTYVIPFPDLVFHFKSGAGKVVKSHVYALKGKPNGNAVLYHYPFGNVYEDGRICWGRNILPDVSCLKEFEQCVLLFFSADTNDDLYSRPTVELNGKKQQLDQRSLLEYLKDRDTFPKELLSKSGNRTINTI